MKASWSSEQPSSVEPSEPDPFDEHEFRAWRGFLRVHRTVMDELARRLERENDLPLLHYGVLITLVSAPERRLRMSDLADQVLTSPSGMTRAVARLREEGLVEREHDPDDLRSFLVSLSPAGVQRLREAQVTHHACVRELLFGGSRRAAEASPLLALLLPVGTSGRGLAPSPRQEREGSFRA
jgi:DNA-binding MarR family transcriptional regulator